MSEIIATPLPRPGADWPERDADGLDADGPAEVEAEDVDTRHWRVEAEAHGRRLDRFLADRVGEFSRSHLQGLVARGCVQVEGQHQTSASARLRVGQLVSVRLEPTAESRAFRPEPMALSLCFEDEHLLVLDKPAGLVVHPAAGNWSGTLLNGLLAHHAGAAALPRAGIVHRLDKDTSGLMVVAKTLPAMTALVRAIAERAVSRRYVALAHGVLRPADRWVEAPIGRDAQQRTRMAVVAGGKPARTRVEVLGTAGEVSAVRCTLDTGRTHQIRVHLASLGHPLLADALYGGRPALGLTRQALHARWLALAHPVTGQALAFECALPPDLRAAWESVGDPAL